MIVDLMSSNLSKRNGTYPGSTGMEMEALDGTHWFVAAGGWASTQTTKDGGENGFVLYPGPSGARLGPQTITVVPGQNIAYHVGSGGRCLRNPTWEYSFTLVGKYDTSEIFMPRESDYRSTAGHETFGDYTFGCAPGEPGAILLEYGKGVE